MSNNFSNSVLEKTRFKTGRQFVYNYEGETVSGVIGASTARSALKIKARVSIETVDHCQHVMKVSKFFLKLLHDSLGGTLSVQLLRGIFSIFS